MTRVLVTGGAGGFGKALVPRLSAAGYTVRIMSRSARSPKYDKLEWAQADLKTGAGVAEAVGDVDVIINCASSGMANDRDVDVVGVERLMQHGAHVRHFIQISIVGIDKVPFSYYKLKVEAEEAVQAGGVPYSIQRITQFHTLIDTFLSVFAKAPLVLPVPAGWVSQPIDVGEAADMIIPLVGGAPAGMLPDVGGPQVLTFKDMAREWLDVRGMHRPIVSLPFPGKTSAGFQQGLHTIPNNYQQAQQGKITWTQWLQQTYGVRKAVRAEA